MNSGELELDKVCANAARYVESARTAASTNEAIAQVGNAVCEMMFAAIQEIRALRRECSSRDNETT